MPMASELPRLLVACGADLAGLRDRALLLLAVAGGLALWGQGLLAGFAMLAALCLSVVAALMGDFVTFAVAHAGSSFAQRWLRGRQSPERLAAARAQFERKGGVLIVVGRVMPAGRIPVLLAAGALEYPWRRLVPAAAIGCVLWALAYAALGVLSGGLFDDPVLATLLAALLVLAVAAAGSLVSSRRRRRRVRSGVIP